MLKLTGRLLLGLLAGIALVGCSCLAAYLVATI